jgi:hypothetical protein
MSDIRDLPDEPTGEAHERDDLFPDETELPSRVRTPVTARGVAIIGARTVAGLVAVGVAVATVAAASLLPLPTVTAKAPAFTVVPVPTAQQLVCPGAILRLADDSGAGATDVSAIGRPTVLSEASGGNVDSVAIQNSEAQTGGGAAAPTVISTPPNQADPSAQLLLSGAQSQQVDAGDFVGLAAAACTRAVGESWLVGGSTTVGRTTLLVLDNPSEVAATVDIELFGAEGAILAPGTRGIIVPPSGQRVLSLAGFQPDVAAPVVHVTSTGGQVSATLQQSIVRGLEPGGVDIVASAPLSSSTIIPGVLLPDVPAAQALRSGGAAFDDVITLLRLFAPGEGTVPVTVSLIPEDGAQTGASFDVELEAGRATEVSLEDVVTGSYTVRIESESPIASAVRATSAVGSTTDFAWYVPAPQLVDEAQLTVAPGMPARLHLANLSATEAVVQLSGVGGVVPITVPAGGGTSVALESGSYTLSGFEQLHAAVTLAGNGLLAHYAVQPPGETSSPLVVYP